MMLEKIDKRILSALAMAIASLLLPASAPAQDTVSSAPSNDVAAANPSDRGDRELPASSLGSHARRVTLEQVKQAADPAIGPLARLGQLTIEAAKQHRLSVQADYFPKFGATLINLHTTDFLGQILTLRHPLAGTVATVPIAILSQNQTIAALTFTQPITPLFQVYQLVKIARADERIAIAKATSSAVKDQRDHEIEETYFKLLIAKRKLTSAEVALTRSEPTPLYASVAIELADTSRQDAQLTERKLAVEKASAEVKRLTTAINLTLGWATDTELELAVPDPLVEDLSLETVADKPGIANAETIEAQQTLVKARAAFALAKLEYMPTVAAVSGYLFQNVIPAVSSNFGYGGFVASYNLFDFGKREHEVSEARAKFEMAELAVQASKAKAQADMKKSYLELQRTRELSQMAQKMGASTEALFRNVSSNSQSLDMKKARADLEAEMLEADLAHRQAYASLKALTSLR
jgi:outer membrane protein TolC